MRLPPRTGRGDGPSGVVHPTEGTHVQVLRKLVSNRSALLRTLLALPLSLSLLFSTAVENAGAITRTEILARANGWVKQRVPYSQRGYFAGYRRDCSGFVSMAWRLSTSYTSRTIGSRAKSIPVSALKPGDAVITPGHVAIFAGWKDRAKRTFVAIEEVGRGQVAVRHVRTLRGNARALRLSNVTEHLAVAVASVPALAAPLAVVLPSAGTTAATRTVSAVAVQPSIANVATVSAF